MEDYAVIDVNLTLKIDVEIIEGISLVSLSMKETLKRGNNWAIMS